MSLAVASLHGLPPPPWVWIRHGSAIERPYGQTVAMDRPQRYRNVPRHKFFNFNVHTHPSITSHQTIIQLTFSSIEDVWPKKIWSDKVKINNDFSYLSDICFDECVNNLNDKLKSFNKHASGCCKSIPLPIDQVGLCTPFCSIKWVPTTKWVRTPQLLVSTKWLHTPSDVLMFNVLLEWVCNPFCRKWVYRHVCSPRWFLQNRWWKLSRSTNSLSTSKEELYKIWHWVLRGGSIYKMGSTLQNGVAQPHLPSKPSGYHWIRYPFYFAHDPIHFSPPWSCPLAVGHFTWKSRIPFRKLKVESRSIPIWCYKVCTNSPGKQR